jgi:outer membrane receptor protein involved in Fe transport
VGQPTRRPENDGRVNPDVPFNTGPTDGIPNAVLIRNRRNATVNFGGVALPLQLANGLNTLEGPDSRLRCFGATSANPGTCLQFAPNGELVPYNPGTNFGTSDASGGDGLYLIETAQVMSDLERNSATVNAHFDLTDNLRVFGDLFAYKAKALELVDQPAYNSASFGGSSGAITLPANHPLLTQQARDTLAGLGVQTFRLSRAHRDLAENNARGETDLYQAVLGLDGHFDAAGRQFEWEIYGNFGKRDSIYYSNQIHRQRFVNAINVANVGGQLQCSVSPGYTGLAAGQGGRVQVGADLPVADAACVPLDVFGEGRPSAAAIDYVSSQQRIDDSAEQRVFNANIGSHLFDVWGGAVAYNVGWESRRESTDFSPDDFMRSGLGRNAAIQRVSGSYRTDEFFGEVIVPLVSGKNEIPLLRELALTGKARRVDNSVNGEFTAWTGGLQWSPVEDLQLRGNVTRSLRAPSLTELYTPVSPLFTQVNDPCSTQFLSSGTRRAVRAANCAEFFAQYGLPANGSWQSTAASSSVQGSSQGNTALRNESANAWTAGFILRPSRIPTLELAVDWVDIRVEDAITNLTANDLAEACFDNADYPNHYCNFFTRNAPGAGDPGQISFVQTGYANGAFQSMAGLTVEGRYRHEFAKLGAFELGLSFYRLSEELRSATGLVRVNSAEQIGSPRNSAQLNLIYEKGPFGARWQSHYVGSQLYNRTFNADSRDILALNSDHTHNLSLYYDVADRAVVRLAVTNLFDGEPPFPVVGDSFNGNYDFLGRRYSLSVSYDFGGK